MMNENNLMDYEIYIYRDKKTTYSALFSGFLLVTYSLDSIFFGYFRNRLEKIVVLKDFTESGREELLIYICLVSGIFLIAYAYSSYISPIIYISQESIVLASKEKRIEDLIFYEFIETNKVVFHFSEEKISLDVDSVSKESLREVLDRL